MTSETPRSLEELRRLSAAELRRLLAREGVSDRGCVEKGDFFALAVKVLHLSEAPPAAPQAVAAPPAPPAPAAAEKLGPALLPRARSRSRSLSLKSEWTHTRTPSPDSRSRSRSSSSSSPGKAAKRRQQARDYGAETMKITPDDAAVLANPKTQEKIARAAEAEVDLLKQELALELKGTTTQRRRARKYAGIVMKQCMGPHFVVEDLDEGDLTVLSVPPDVVGYVQGQGGNVLRSIEEEWGTLMVFIDTDLSRAQRLAIFGSVRGRRGSELKVLSAVETKMPGYFAACRDEVINRDKYRDEEGSWGTDTMTFRDEGEISYALGKQGGTRRKLERSTGAIVQYVGMVAICSGTKLERQRAREYMKWLFQQLEGPVYVDGLEAREDCTVVDIPGDCIGYITGNRRATLGALEEEWGTLMFFVNESEDKGRGRGNATAKLAIFGPNRPRRGSELKVMSGIETKSPGFFTRGLKEKTSSRRGFCTDRMTFRDDELSYALGKDGNTRKKLELASGAILQYVGLVAFIAGNIKERRRCKEFVNWLLQQRRGTVTIADISKRDDCTEVHIPVNCKGWVTGNRGSELRRMEQASGTYMFLALDSTGEERLLIFGSNPGNKYGEGGRAHAERMVLDMIREKQEDDARRPPRGRSFSRSPKRRSRSRSRSSSPRRRRSRSRSHRGGRGGLRGWGDRD